MAVSRLYYIPVSGEMQCRYGEIKAISRWNLKIPFRSGTPMNRRSLRSTGGLNTPIKLADFFVTD